MAVCLPNKVMFCSPLCCTVLFCPISYLLFLLLKPSTKPQPYIRLCFSVQSLSDAFYSVRPTTATTHTHTHTPDHILHLTPTLRPTSDQFLHPTPTPTLILHPTLALTLSFALPLRPPQNNAHPDPAKPDGKTSFICGMKKPTRLASRVWYVWWGVVWCGVRVCMVYMCVV